MCDNNTFYRVYHLQGKPAQIKYAATFAYRDHKPGTGPFDCGNCAYFGIKNDEFYGYCLNCHHYIYKGQRPVCDVPETG